MECDLDDGLVAFEKELTPSIRISFHNGCVKCNIKRKDGMLPTLRQVYTLSQSLASLKIPISVFDEWEVVS